MANFYDVHRKAIQRAFSTLGMQVGDIFNVAMQEPLPPPMPIAPMSESITILGFRVLPKNRFEPARPCDREAIADWCERHKHDDDDAWELPDFGGAVGGSIDPA